MTTTENSSISGQVLGFNSEAVLPDTTNDRDDLLSAEEIEALKELEDQGKFATSFPAEDETGDEPSLDDDDPIAIKDPEGGEAEEEAETGAESDKPEAAEEEAADGDEEPEKARAQQEEYGAYPDPNAAKAAVDQVDAAMKKAFDDLSDGEITDAEYQQKMTALTAERDQANEALFNARRDNERWMNAWNQTVQTYAKSNAEIFADPEVRKHYDSYVRAVNGSTSEAIQKLSMTQKLALAHKRLATDAEVLGITVPQPGAAPKAKADPKPAAPTAEQKREAALGPKAAKAEPPKTLRDMPASAMSDTETAFQKLEKLSAVDAETAFERMSPEQQDAYLMGNL
ncbi:hypothetical protein [Mesobacterium pallidum]|uniref:hypothetical protein n=1 Tax=Mesobacterium pallidum TaxID=2872037 RepID=UPI001EE266F6|nr:hypothetical protein [Mesobacterium pallidum]